MIRKNYDPKPRLTKIKTSGSCNLDVNVHWEEQSGFGEEKTPVGRFSNV